MKRLFLALLVGLFMFGNAQSAERILKFHSEILVQKDGSLDVVETITVRSEQKKYQARYLS